MRIGILISLFITGSLKHLEATHIVGGEIYYDCLGGDNYKITLKVYRDCSPNNTNGTLFDDPAPIGIYESGFLINTLYVNIQSITPVPLFINDPCMQAPPNVCVEQAIYSVTTNLPSNGSGYDIVYQRCCRNPSIINIINSQDYGSSYYSHIPAAGLVSCNSSPRFSGLPPLVICNGSNFSFDHSATDIDGDDLVYEFYTPFNGGDPFNPAPNPPSAPPYANVIWNTGFSQNTQISGSTAFTLDASGIFEGVPNVNGLYVFGITVKEYRNGILLSQSYRDFQTTVTNCPSVVVSSVPVQTDLCNGMTANFGNNSQNAVYYHWDFGVSSLLNDTSNIFEPSYTFSDTGSYTITLIANPGFSCADTAYQTYDIRLPLDVHFTAPEPQCISNNSFDFNVTGTFTNNAIISWEFGPLANPMSSSLQNPTLVSYSDSGHFNVSVTVTEFGCTDSFDDTIHVFPLPVIGFIYPPQTGCVPYAVQFIDTSMSWEVLNYSWTFGDGTISGEQNPSHLYSVPGIYDVSLTVQVDSICTFSQTISLPDLITVHPRPDALVTSDLSEQSAFHPNFTFFDMSAGSISETMYFENGDTSSLNEVPYTFYESGNHPVMLIAVNEFGCTDTSYVTVYVIPETTIYIPNAFTPNNDDLNDVFIPVVYDVNSYDFMIFDRWGQIIYQSTKQGDGWDGTRNGKLCPIDTYVYQLNYSDRQDIARVIRGHFTLVR